MQYQRSYLRFVIPKSLKSLLCISSKFLSDCICRIFRMIFGVRQIRFFERSFGAFFAISMISVVVLFKVCFSVSFNIRLLKLTILWRLFFPSASFGKNIFFGFPLRINLASLFTLLLMSRNHLLNDHFLFLLKNCKILLKIVSHDIKEIYVYIHKIVSQIKTLT